MYEVLLGFRFNLTFSAAIGWIPWAHERGPVIGWEEENLRPRLSVLFTPRYFVVVAGIKLRPDSPYAKEKICSELYGPLFREFRKCLWNVLRLICKPPLSGKVSEIANVPFKTKFGPISSVKLSIRQRRRPRKSSCSSKTSSKECIISCERRIKNWFRVS